MNIINQWKKEKNKIIDMQKLKSTIDLQKNNFKYPSKRR